MRSIILEYPGVLLITLLSSQWVWSFKTTLECYTKGLRLLFQPKEPFYGHIYVKGSFMQKNCHLDYTKIPLTTPSYFVISYKSGCNLKCEEQKEPPGINYHLLVVVQNHRWFVTRGDRIYSVNCFYQKDFDNLAQDLEIRNGLVTVRLSGESIIKCTYRVLDSLNGELVKYANVGDKLFHKWSCPSAKYGMLVHSCYARETDDVAFQLVDDRGCVIDDALMSPLIYNDDLTSAHSIIPAFKFADQLAIRFQCKVTLCIRSQNNCESTTPPVCEKSPEVIFYDQESGTIEEAEVTTESALSSNTKLSCRTIGDGTEKQCRITSEGTIRPRNDTDVADYASNNDGGSITESSISTASNRMNNEASNNKQKRSVNESRLTTNPLSRKFFTAANSTGANRLILDVNADQLIIFEQNEMNQTDSINASNISCMGLRNGILLQTVIFILLSGLFLTIIFMQKYYYNKHLLKSDFIPYSKKYIQ